MRIIFSANDAGAGNCIYPLIKKLQKSHKLLVIASGPSKEILSSHNISFQNGDSTNSIKLTTLVYDFEADVFVSGSSLGMTIDKEILNISKLYNIPSVYILDFWSNYWQRFSTSKKDFRFLPTKICVMDKIAKEEMLKEGFYSKVIAITGNPYFDQFRKKTYRKARRNKIVFVSQPLSKINHKKNIKHFRVDEVIVLNALLSVLANIKSPYELIIRPHPSESRNKFEKIVSKYNLGVTFDGGSLENCLSSSQLVIGINSAALLVANLMGKSVISYFSGEKGDFNIIKKCLGIKTVVSNVADLKTLIEKYFNSKLGNTTTTPLLVANAKTNIFNIISLYGKR